MLEVMLVFDKLLAVMMQLMAMSSFLQAETILSSLEMR